MAYFGDPKLLWRRYVLAIALIVATLTGSHIATLGTLGGGVEATRVVNIAGRQRMLSQRILYFAGRDMQAATGAVPDSRLDAAIDLFAASHFNLTYGGGMGLSAERATQRQRYYASRPAGAPSLHALAVDFIADARLITGGTPRQRSAAWDRIQSAGPGILLARLDDAVTAFEGMAHARTARMELIARTSFVLALLILVAEGLFIFLPAQRTITAAVNRMQGAIDRLQDAKREVTANLRQAQTARRRAEAAERAKDQFLSHMSHELRTPLNGLVGMLDLIADAPDAPCLAERIALAQESARHLVAITNNVLDLSKLEAGKVEVETRPVDPLDLGRAALATFRVEAERKGIDLRVVAAPDLPDRIGGDATRLRQVTFNLVSNAIKFTERGSVELHLAYRDGRLGIEVRDTGPGIPEADRGRLFERFEQLDASITRRHGGTGLGLAISRQLVGLMGGAITARDNPGGGSVFAVDLPAAVLSGAATAAAGPPSDAPSPVAGLRALVAEDNRVNRMVIGALLDRLGIEVEMVEDGARAVTLAGETDFDVVLMDLQMPVLDGLSAARRIRTLPGRRGRVPMLAVTANVSDEDARLCRSAGFDGSLGKPIRLAALEASIARLRQADRQTARPAA